MLRIFLTTLSLIAWCVTTVEGSFKQDSPLAQMMRQRPQRTSHNVEPKKHVNNHLWHKHSLENQQELSKYCFALFNREYQCLEEELNSLPAILYCNLYFAATPVHKKLILEKTNKSKIKQIKDNLAASIAKRAYDHKASQDQVHALYLEEIGTEVDEQDIDAYLKESKEGQQLNKFLAILETQIEQKSRVDHFLVVETTSSSPQD
jgi:hypothetical protein